MNPAVWRSSSRSASSGVLWMTRSSGTSTSVSRTSWLCEAASTGVAQNGRVVTPGEEAGISISASAERPSSSVTCTLAVSTSIEPERLHGFFAPLTR